MLLAVCFKRRVNVSSDDVVNHQVVMDYRYKQQTVATRPHLSSTSTQTLAYSRRGRLMENKMSLIDHMRSKLSRKQSLGLCTGYPEITAAREPSWNDFFKGDVLPIAESSIPMGIHWMPSSMFRYYFTSLFLYCLSIVFILLENSELFF